LLLSGVIDLLILVLIQESLVAYSSHLLLANYALQTIERLLGHSDIKTTMIYLQTVPSVTLKEAKSPLIACRAALAPRLFRWIDAHCLGPEQVVDSQPPKPRIAEGCRMAEAGGEARTAGEHPTSNN
jgi:hypothetical protein